MLMKDIVEGVEYAYEPHKNAAPRRVRVDGVRVHRTIRGDWRNHKSARRDGVLVMSLDTESGDIQRYQSGDIQGRPIVSSILPRFLTQTWTAQMEMDITVAASRAKFADAQAALLVTLTELVETANAVIGYEAFEVHNQGRRDNPRWLARLKSQNVDELMRTIAKGGA